MLEHAEPLDVLRNSLRTWADHIEAACLLLDPDLRCDDFRKGKGGTQGNTARTDLLCPVDCQCPRASVLKIRPSQSSFTPFGTVSLSLPAVIWIGLSTLAIHSAAFFLLPCTHPCSSRPPLGRFLVLSRRSLAGLPRLDLPGGRAAWVHPTESVSTYFTEISLRSFARSASTVL